MYFLGNVAALGAPSIPILCSTAPLDLLIPPLSANGLSGLVLDGVTRGLPRAPGRCSCCRLQGDCGDALHDHRSGSTNRTNVAMHWGMA